MSCSNDDRWDWDLVAEKENEFEGFLQEMSNEFII